MVGIPRFEAQLQSLQIPSMKNYQEAQNASITESVAKFGSDLMDGVIKAKKKKSEKYNELLQEGKTLSGRDDTVQKNNTDSIQNAFNTTFYNDAFKTLQTIATNNKDNPAEIEEQSTAYIDGVVSDFPEQQQKEIRKGLELLKNSYSQQSLEEYNARQNASAKQDVINNIFNARAIAISSVQQGAPEGIQMASSMNYIQNVRQARKTGDISPEEETQLIESFGKNIIVNHLGDILNDKNVNAEEKAKWIRRFADGKTGDKFIDEIMSPVERTNAVNLAMNNARQLNDFQESIKKERDGAQQKAFDKSYVDTTKNMYLTTDFAERQALQDDLLMAAETPDQVDKAINIQNNMNKPSNAYAIMQMDKLLRDGTLTQKILDNGVETGTLSPADYTTYSAKLDEPLAQNKGKDVTQVALQEARKSYGYTPFGSNNGYETFVANLDRRLSDKLMTNKELSDAIKEAFAETDGLYPRSAQGTVQKIEEFNKKYGTPIEDVKKAIEEKSLEIASTKVKRQTQITPEIMAQAQREALFEIAAQKVAEKKGRTEDFNIFVQDYLDATGGQ